MAIRRAIIFSGPEGSGKGLGATIAGAYMRKQSTNGAPTHTKFVAPLQQGINTAFGLSFSPELYLEKGDEPLAEFFGHAPQDVYDAFLNLCQEKFKHNILGRVALRRIKADTQSYTYIFSDCPSLEDAAALSIGLGKENVLIIHLGDKSAINPEWNTHINLRECAQRFVPDKNTDAELFRIFTRAAVKAFMGYEES